MLRIDFSKDGNWIRAEARSKTADATASPLAIILLSASSGEICEDQAVRSSVRSWVPDTTSRHDIK